MQFVFTGSVLGTVVYLLPARMSRGELAVARCHPLGAYLSGWGEAELGEVYLYSESDQSSCSGGSCWVWSSVLVLSWVGSSCKSLRCTTAFEQHMAQTSFSGGISLLMSISRDCCVDRTLE